MNNQNWRAEQCEDYYSVDVTAEAYCNSDHRFKEDNDLFKIGNYFKTKDQAEELARRYKQLIQEYQEELKTE